MMRGDVVARDRATNPPDRAVMDGIKTCGIARRPSSKVLTRYGRQVSPNQTA